MKASTTFHSGWGISPTVLENPTRYREVVLT